jgi:antibiotic biosynthesis monooxygenase (ABM) superfamily enzyme
MTTQVPENERDTIIPGKRTVTVVVSRTVFPGHDKEYEEWAQRLMEAAKESPGCSSVTILVPESGKAGLRHVVMHFTDEKSMHIWETSYVRQKLSHEADAFSRRMRQEATGLETWFSIPECPQLETPPHWKMAVVTFIAVFLASCAIIKIIDLFWKEPNFWAFNTVVGAVLVALLTWVIMPIFSRYIFRKWLYKN